MKIKASTRDFILGAELFCHYDREEAKSLTVEYEYSLGYCIFRVVNKGSQIYSGENYEQAVKYYNDIKGDDVK